MELTNLFHTNASGSLFSGRCAAPCKNVLCKEWIMPLRNPSNFIIPRMRTCKSRRFKASATASDQDTTNTILDKEAEAPPVKKGSVGSFFDNAFTYTAWLEVHRVLTERKLPSVAPKEALEMAINKSAVLLDVREPQDYAEIHAEGAANAPLFRLITGNDLKANLRRLGNALLTNFGGTERNPDLVAQAEAAVDGDKTKTVIVICARGGTLDTIITRGGKKVKTYKDPDRVHGDASRSLKAAYELQEAGFENVIHLKGGLNQWLSEDLPSMGTKV